MLNPKLPFSPWQDMTIGQKVIELFNVADTGKRYAGWKAIDREAMEIGAKIPLLQSVQTLARQKNLAVTKYANGWVLAQTMRWT
jgi:peptide/nickel transport system substrate-binding protein